MSEDQTDEQTMNMNSCDNMIHSQENPIGEFVKLLTLWIQRHVGGAACAGFQIP